ncbi:endospore germination permease [Paenibacillus sp. LHD-117]|uniref:GerAB/ArcD/ProY family transporter n=1 Tax=Paenibacillus sp. LHD-117 TaxID=3071412 RepID=UPI0027E19860|nr:endospore germination permease [Paenibacillus sp. LHD-117]MDQ6418796.1 endospore germination permease [Paenibacillus sp. LHD-117]
MVDKEKINVRQFGLFVVIYSIGTPILIVPAGLTSIAKQDAWIAATIGIGIGLLLVSLYQAVGKLFPEKSLVETTELLLGKWIGNAVSFTFVFFCLIAASELFYYVGNFMTTQIMSITPIQSINIIFAVVVVMGIKLGIETLARSAELMFPIFIVLFLILVVFVSPQIEIERIQPVLETKLKDLTWATMYFTSNFSLTQIALLMIFPSFVDRPEAASKAFYKGMIIGGIVLVVIIALCILVLGADTTARQTFPSYALAKKINVGQFLQRIEIVMAIMWFITIYYRLCIYFHGAAMGLAHVLKLKDYKFLVLPLGMIVVSLSLIVHPNTLHMEEYTQHAWLPYVMTYGLFLPLLLLVVHAIRKKRQ